MLIMLMLPLVVVGSTINLVWHGMGRIRAWVLLVRQASPELFTLVSQTVEALANSPVEVGRLCVYPIIYDGFYIYIPGDPFIPLFI